MPEAAHVEHCQNRVALLLRLPAAAFLWAMLQAGPQRPTGAGLHRHHPDILFARPQWSWLCTVGAVVNFAGLHALCLSATRAVDGATALCLATATRDRIQAPTGLPPRARASQAAPTQGCRSCHHFAARVAGAGPAGGVGSGACIAWSASSISKTQSRSVCCRSRSLVTLSATFTRTTGRPNWSVARLTSANGAGARDSTGHGDEGLGGAMRTEAGSQ